VQSASDIKLNLYAQEPRFTALDVEFLRSLDFQILDSPEAEDHVSMGTFLYIPFLEWETETAYRVKAVNCDVYVSHSVDTVLEHAERVKRDLDSGHDQNDDTAGARLELANKAVESARAIQDTHTALRFPDFEYSNALDMTLYTKKEAVED